MLALTEPALQLAPGATAAISERVLLSLPHLRLLHKQRMEIGHRIDAVLKEIGTEGKFAGHRDVHILRSLPGVGRTVSATMLAEAGAAFFDPPARVALSALRDELLFAIGIGLAPATCLSVIALALGYRAGYATRHEADLARIERAGDSPRGAS